MQFVYAVKLPPGEEISAVFVQMPDGRLVMVSGSFDIDLVEVASQSLLKGGTVDIRDAGVYRSAWPLYLTGPKVKWALEGIGFQSPDELESQPRGSIRVDATYICGEEVPIFMCAVPQVVASFVLESLRRNGETILFIGKMYSMEMTNFGQNRIRAGAGRYTLVWTEEMARDNITSILKGMVVKGELIRVVSKETELVCRV